jgi:hypothetical protein
MSKQRQPKKKEITLMTVLAYESTSDAQKLLKKYGREPAKGYTDLEVKLANLYFNTPDKVQLEKELAEIHPHKKWLLDNITPLVTIEKQEISIEAKPNEQSQKEIEELKKLLDAQNESDKMEDFKAEMRKALQEEFNKVEIKSGFQGITGGSPSYSQCASCQKPVTNFAGDVERTQNTATSNISPYVGLIGIFAIVGLTVIVIQKIK